MNGDPSLPSTPKSPTAETPKVVSVINMYRILYTHITFLLTCLSPKDKQAAEMDVFNHYTLVLKNIVAIHGKVFHVNDFMALKWYTEQTLIWTKYVGDNILIA